MKRTRTIFVSLVILLVSMTMVIGTGTAAPLEPDVGFDWVGDVPPEGGTDGTDDWGTNGSEDGEGDPGDAGDGYGAYDDKGCLPSVGWTAAVTSGLTWSHLLDLLFIQTLVVP